MSIPEAFLTLSNDVLILIKSIKNEDHKILMSKGSFCVL